jgi:hypothetical protein
MRGWAALLVALPFALILAWWEPSGAPSRAELARALGRAETQPVSAADVRDIDCARQSDVLGYPCHWRQMQDGTWHRRSGLLATGTEGWRIVAIDNLDPDVSPAASSNGIYRK